MGTKPPGHGCARAPSPIGDRSLMSTIRKNPGIRITPVFQGNPRSGSGDFPAKKMHPLAAYEKKLLEVIRMDLQLHFFWSFALTILAIFWKPFIIAGLVVTVTKEFLDLTAQKGWSWGDFNWGMAGFFAGVLFIHQAGFWE
ncbi:conserved hypothetical protein [Candidatus Desulfarcum epimagneticum]|uniref:Uncharacterized protein n=1 Tax=uncultured Desulfobacteraceae bacterium TaxID=218296 RepID=A0A484HEQ7_9BACT|nr:conserved hypothetical protein [uncultured Desulfobacteraceae bacterium]